MMNKLISKIAFFVHSMSRLKKRVFVLVLDAYLCLLTVWLAYYLRLGEFINIGIGDEVVASFILATTVSIVLALPIFIILGFYRAIFRYSGWLALLALAKGVGIYGLLYAAVFNVLKIPSTPPEIGIIQPLLLLFFLGASRAFARKWLGDTYKATIKQNERLRVLVYGAGRSGRGLVAALSNSREVNVLGFLDDDQQIHGHLINNKLVYDPASLRQLVKNLQINTVLMALENISRKRMNEIINSMHEAKVKLRTLPSILDLVQGDVSLSNDLNFNGNNLLERETVSASNELLSRKVKSKVVMVTGAGGSIGKELCRQILMIQPSKLLMVEQSEFDLYTIHKELEENNIDPNIILVPLLGSVQDQRRINEIISTWLPNTIYHAAAYKHVHLVEHNFSEGIKNNVFGTLYTAIAAEKYNVSDFVFISTDKAVRPTGMMGATKRLAEIILQARAAKYKNVGTNFSIVRFGNVLSSSGSVVPKFCQQIKEGRHVTLTHPNVTRYFMTILEAAQLVIQAGAMSQGGDVFLLDMGQPIKIKDLAIRMINLSGLTVRDDKNPEGDIEIIVTGLRPGEKLHEELLIGNNPMPTEHPRIMRAEENFIPWNELESRLKLLELSINRNDACEIRVQMQQMVTEYTPSDVIVDWIYLKKDQAKAF
jgi:FlaA1/EpsC-like NDP-sugar epimerase